MKLSAFDINFIKFKNEKDVLHFKLNDTFFGLKENSLYEACDIDVSIQCKRNDGNIALEYVLKGHVSSTCERCLKEILLPVDATSEEMLKLTVNEELLQEENYISAHTQVYNVYDSLYEHICLSMPTRQICENSTLKTACKLHHPTTANQEPIADERWAELKKINNK
jgi:uncharacterized metal-binding protein YceD (DUF177 family)